MGLGGLFDVVVAGCGGGCGAGASIPGGQSLSLDIEREAIEFPSKGESVPPNDMDLLRYSWILEAHNGCVFACV